MMRVVCVECVPVSGSGLAEGHVAESRSGGGTPRAAPTTERRRPQAAGSRAPTHGITIRVTRVAPAGPRSNCTKHNTHLKQNLTGEHNNIPLHSRFAFEHVCRTVGTRIILTSAEQIQNLRYA